MIVTSQRNTVTGHLKITRYVKKILLVGMRRQITPVIGQNFVTRGLPEQGMRSSIPKILQRRHAITHLRHVRNMESVMISKRKIAREERCAFFHMKLRKKPRYISWRRATKDRPY